MWSYVFLSLFAVSTCAFKELNYIKLEPNLQSPDYDVVIYIDDAPSAQSTDPEILAAINEYKSVSVALFPNVFIRGKEIGQRDIVKWSCLTDLNNNRPIYVKQLIYFNLTPFF